MGFEQNEDAERNRFRATDGWAGFQPPGKEEVPIDQLMGIGLSEGRRKAATNRVRACERTNKLVGLWLVGTPSGRLETRPSEIFETGSAVQPYL